MKIGVITFWHGNDNYGMILQCWALQTKLKELGHEPYIIRYIPDLNTNKIKKIIKIITCYNLFYKLFHIKKTILFYSLNKKSRLRDFNTFRKENLKFSSKIYHSLKQLQNNPPEADCYITGSDQVWAQLLNNPNNRAFFLDFGDKAIKRVAYAPSFAMKKYPFHLLLKLQTCLSNINFLSCREYDGVNICKELGFNSLKVLDPTLLLTKEQYLKLIDSTISYPNKFIFVYSLNIQTPEDIRWHEFESYSKEQNLDIIVTPSNGYFPGLEIFPGHVKYSYSTVHQWISQIYNSTLVITPSFHGIVFSIILEKDFIYVPLKGKFSHGNNRVVDLLKDLGLLNRILYDNTTLTELINSPIDWISVKNRLQNLKISSINFLTNSLNSK